MPYTPSTVPDHVPTARATQWAGAWNGAYRDCIADGGSEEPCEQRAFRVANALLKESEQDKRMSTTVLIEQIELIEGTFDPERRTVKQRIIRAGESANGRYYKPETLQAALPLFARANVYADHPTPQAQRMGQARSVRETSGWLADPVFENNALVATRHFTKNQAGRDMMDLVSDIVDGIAPPTLMGASINAVGKVAEGEVNGKKTMMVEAITAVNSVDDVSSPAAGGGFEPLIHSGNVVLANVLEAMEFDEWRAARPEFEDKLKNEWKAVRQTEAVAAAIAERDQAQAALVEANQQMEAKTQQVSNLETELASLRADLARKALEVELEKALREHRLPIEWETQLRAQLAEVEPAKWPAIIEAEARKASGLKAQRGTVPVSGAPQRVATSLVVTPPKDGPIYLSEDATPDDLAAELERRSK